MVNNEEGWPLSQTIDGDPSLELPLNAFIPGSSVRFHKSLLHVLKPLLTGSDNVFPTKSNIGEYLV